MTAPRVARISIDGDAFRHNLGRVKAFAPNSRVMAVIKANAYGHGVFSAAEHLSEADAFALVMPGEALQLRRAGVTKPLVVLQGFMNNTELADIAASNIEPAINNEEQIERLERHQGEPLKVWLKVDTGMHRLGIPADSATAAYQRLQACSSVSEVRIMSHFANADDPDNSYNNKQLESLLKVNNNIGAELSMANSGGIVAIPESHLQWVRPGIMLYGSSPLLEKTAEELDLRPVMTFESQLIAVQPLKKGDVIGYGSSWQCPEDMPVGVIAAGYADGYPRHAEAGTPVWINNQQCPLVGRVSMDSICIDLRGVEAKPGDRAVLWGRELSVDIIARHAGTIGYELLCSAGNANL